MVQKRNDPSLRFQLIWVEKLECSDYGRIVTFPVSFDVQKEIFRYQRLYPQNQKCIKRKIS